ncbi:MAG: tRNA (N6-threonylcarbamoyladenosine(37)-N6)-methyltransferase TrmO [Rhizobiaceae bacterium]|nr:tRNA (N6-threonylcarbamoyladenosine(37)-N6)-methyltransferase TrmO [Rhizobiaceae bacterium]MCV0408533.1 tRNA (N6-threonylcarbamoyladenosine(37)-N6)-methyltransferase TrmO [Rhizobiaceae bacterium]
MTSGDPRPGEKRLPADPAGMAGDARVVFIGRVRSPWTDRTNCPKNMAAARQQGGGGTVEIDALWREGLAGLDDFSHICLLSWLEQAPRDLIVQMPRHAETPRGVFSLRSPARPNPVGLHIARLAGIDAGAGLLHLEAIDLLDGTPVIDVKPYYASTDAVADAATPSTIGR